MKNLHKPTMPSLAVVAICARVSFLAQLASTATLHCRHQFLARSCFCCSFYLWPRHCFVCQSVRPNVHTVRLSHAASFACCTIRSLLPADLRLKQDPERHHSTPPCTAQQRCSKRGHEQGQLHRGDSACARCSGNRAGGRFRQG